MKYGVRTGWNVFGGDDARHGVRGTRREKGVVAAACARWPPPPPPPPTRTPSIFCLVGAQKGPAGRRCTVALVGGGDEGRADRPTMATLAASVRVCVCTRLSPLCFSTHFSLFLFLFQGVCAYISVFLVTAINKLYIYMT